MWSGPSNHYWQQFLERTFKGRKDAATVVEKVIVDQLVYGPLCNILLLSYISLLIEGTQRLEELVDRARLVSVNCHNVTDGWPIRWQCAGKSVEATSAKLRESYPGIQLNGWKVCACCAAVCCRNLLKLSVSAHLTTWLMHT